MARKEKNTVKYFPLDCEWGDSIKYIEDVYGNDGFIVWVRLLRKLGRSDYHFFDWQDIKQRKILCAEMRLDEAVVHKILNELCDFECIDKELWEQEIIFSENFVEGIKDAYRSRKTTPLFKNDIISFLTDKNRFFAQKHAGNCKLYAGNEEKHAGSTQSKVKESKLNKSKVNSSSCENSEDEIIEPVIGPKPQISSKEEEFLKVFTPLKGYQSPESIDLQMYSDLRKKYAHDVIIASLRSREIVFKNQKSIVDWVSGYKEIKKGNEGIEIPPATPIELPEKSHPTDSIKTREKALEYLGNLLPEIRFKGPKNKALAEKFKITPEDFA